MSYFISMVSSVLVSVLCVAALAGAYMGHKDKSFKFYPQDKWILAFIGIIGAANLVNVFTL